MSDGLIDYMQAAEDIEAAIAIVHNYAAQVWGGYRAIRTASPDALPAAAAAATAAASFASPHAPPAAAAAASFASLSSHGCQCCMGHCLGQRRQAVSCTKHGTGSHERCTSPSCSMWRVGANELTTLCAASLQT
jgi:hypothetical protein